MIRIFRTGAHAHRTPLAYPALAPLWADFIAPVDDPGRADIHVFAHSLDVAAAPCRLIEDWRVRRRPIVILSEEPFWDTLWGRRPLARRQVIDTRYGALPVIQLNHHTSDIFRFDRIPYYLLTNHRFANTYAARFHRNAALSAADWRDRFAARPVDLTFMFERRPEPHHDVQWPEGGVLGLCAWRTRLAEACTEGTVERLGQSWHGGPTRFEIGDWHLDKVVRLDGRSRIVAAIENTHQPAYVTEKLFDAFACGALPLYFAAPDHRVHDFGLPAGAWLNLFGLDAAEAAGQAQAAASGYAAFADFAEAQRQLARLFGDTRLWVAERARVARALRTELERILDAPRAG